MNRDFEFVGSFEVGCDVHNDGGSTASAKRNTLFIPSTPRPLKEYSVADLELLNLVRRLFLNRGQGVPQVVSFCPVDLDVNAAPVCARIAELLLSKTSAAACIIDANSGIVRLADCFGTNRDLPLRLTPTGVYVQQVSKGLYLVDSFPDGDEAFGAVATFREAFDFVFVNAEAVLASGANLNLSAAADATILVAGAEKTRSRDVSRARKQLDSLGANVVGALLVNRRFPIPAMVYRYL